MAGQTTQNLEGILQEMSPHVENITPVDTTFQNMIGSETIHNPHVQWNEEELAAVAKNAHVQGAAAPAHVDNILIPRENHTQIFMKTVVLTRTMQKTLMAGNVQELSHQVNLRGKELKRDIEHAFVGTGQTAVRAVGATTPGELAGYQSQIDAGNKIDGSSSAITKAMLDKALVKLATQGANVDTVMCHPELMMSLTNALGKDTIERDIGTGTTINTKVEIYKSPVGEVRLVQNRFVKFDTSTSVGDILVFDSSMWSELILDPIMLEKLGKVGDYSGVMLVTERSLKNKSQKASGLIYDAKA